MKTEDPETMRGEGREPAGRHGSTLVKVALVSIAAGAVAAFWLGSRCRAQPALSSSWKPDPELEVKSEPV